MSGGSSVTTEESDDSARELELDELDQIRIQLRERPSNMRLELMDEYYSNVVLTLYSIDPETFKSAASILLTFAVQTSAIDKFIEFDFLNEAPWLISRHAFFSLFLVKIAYQFSFSEAGKLNLEEERIPSILVNMLTAKTYEHAPLILAKIAFILFSRKKKYHPEFLPLMNAEYHVALFDLKKKKDGARLFAGITRALGKIKPDSEPAHALINFLIAAATQGSRELHLEEGKPLRQSILNSIEGVEENQYLKTLKWYSQSILKHETRPSALLFKTKTPVEVADETTLDAEF